MIRMDGWLYESTVLIENSSIYDRNNEYIEITLTLPLDKISDPKREVRVVYKPEWNIWDRTIPCQIDNIKRVENKVKFTVSFLANLKSNSTARYGILYGNKNCLESSEQFAITTSSTEKEITIDNNTYVLSLDKSSGNISNILYKYYRTGFLLPISHTPNKNIQTGVAIEVPLNQENSLISSTWLTSSKSKAVESSSSSGAVYFRHKSVKALSLLNGDNNNSDILVESTLLCVAEQPTIYITEKITFKSDTKVFGIKLCNHQFTDGVYSHFSFRPVTKGMNKNEIEEIGHILIDPNYTSELPEGSVLSGFLPLKMAWTALLNIRRNSGFSQTRYLLNYSVDNSFGKTVPEYRAATYLLRENGGYEIALMPIYTKNTSDIENLTVIPSGTTISTTVAIHLSPFEEVSWGNKADEIGKRLNSPIKISVNPKPLLDNNEWGEHESYVCTGNRYTDYLTSGVR